LDPTFGMLERDFFWRNFGEIRLRGLGLMEIFFLEFSGTERFFRIFKNFEKIIKCFREVWKNYFVFRLGINSEVNSSAPISLTYGDGKDGDLRELFLQGLCNSDLKMHRKSKLIFILILLLFCG